MTINNSYKGSKQNYIQSITGPQLISVSGSTVINHEKFPTLVLSGGLKLNTNLKNRYHTLSVDIDYIEKAMSGSGGSGDRIESPNGSTAFVQAFDEEKLESHVTGSTGVYHSVISGTYSDFGISLPIINKKEMLESGDIKVLNDVLASSNFQIGTHQTRIITGPLEEPATIASIDMYNGGATTLVSMRAKNENIDALIDVGGNDSAITFKTSSDSIVRIEPSEVSITVSGSTDPIVIVDSDTPNLPAEMNSIVHGLHVLSSSMPAPPELEWWDPVWTPSSSNISSVNNIECQYTRVYRAAGGSLVTLEGTLRVEITNDSAFTIFTTELPVPATGTGSLRAPGICTAANRPDRSMVRITLSGTGSARNLSISAPPLLDATGVPATLTIGFRISYRAV